MPKELVFNALNEQITSELSAWYSYLGMSAWCSSQQLNGSARWLRAQAQEEYTHAMKIYDFLLHRSAPVTLKMLQPAEVNFNSVEDVFQTALQQEEENTRRINAIFQMALDQQAFASMVELQWFIAEQVEEERTARENLARVQMVNTDPAAILEFDRVLGERELVLETSPA